jgi:transposase
VLDHVPARLRVIRIRRARYGCRICGTIHQVPAPDRPIAKGRATPALLAHVLVAKYADHLPLYRQNQIFARQGVDLGRSTLANWVGGAVWWLEPLHARLAEHVFASQKLFADDTPIPVLDPGRGRTKTGRLWVYARDDRPWSGTDPPAAVYFYSPDRRAERPASHLARFRGIIQVDGYPGFGRLGVGGNIRRPAGPMRGASSTRCTKPPDRPSRPRRCGALPNSMPSRQPSGARRPTLDRRCDRPDRSL